jgi:hypothetical protein
VKQVSRQKVGIVVLQPNHCFLGFLVMIDVPDSKDMYHGCVVKPTGNLLVQLLQIWKPMPDRRWIQLASGQEYNEILAVSQYV